MKRFLLLFLCVCTLPVTASHIVGGEFEIYYLSPNKYRVNLILYFDLLHGVSGAKDPDVYARIFRKSDNAPMMTVYLPIDESLTTQVSYMQPSCSKGEIKTEKLYYTAVITLSDAQFSDPAGYYISWERCCRNYEIDNIYSEDPNNPGTYTGKYAGQTFYLEFPPVTKDGQPFINSTPRLFPPLNDYGCPGRPYYTDFAGTDDDGDSLAYTLVEPLNTWSSSALPGNDNMPKSQRLPNPGPYPTIKWRNGFSLANITGGSPDLKISTDGFLTITPRQPPLNNDDDDPGDLLVFAVKCEEFRDGVKIGEVRRDFQMLVLKSCPVADPPQIVGKKLTDGSFTYDENMVVSFSNTVGDGDRCIQVQVSDPDASKLSDNFQEKIKIKAIPLNFKKNINGILPDVVEATLSHGSTRTFDICFDQCPYIKDGPFQVGIVAFDDACALPLLDTLKVLVNIQPPANDDPYFTTPDVQQLVNEGDVQDYPIHALDPDGDHLIVGIMNDGFSLANVGMKLTTNNTPQGTLDAVLHWDSKCDVYDFTKKTSFELKFLIEDDDICKVPEPDTMILKLQIKLPGNADPIISTDLTPDEVANGVERKVFESLDFNVFGNDSDGDHLVLTASGLGYNMTTYSMAAPQHTASGHVQTHFNWNLLCNPLNLKAKDVFDVRFIVVDNANKCRFYKADTLNVKIKVLPPDNEQPVLSIVNNNPSLALVDNEQSLILGEQIALGLLSADPYVSPHADHVKIELIGAEGNVEPKGYEFAEAEGDGSAQTTFVWKPDCSIFENGVYENNYTFTFRTFDDRCFNPKADTVELKINIKDVDGSDSDFIPPNVVTANGDGCNDFFAMEEVEELVSCDGSSLILPNLPKDNCLGHFQEVFIYNRWGREVFRSQTRNFRWYPTSEAVGVYFYTLKFSHKEYKGTIHLRN